MILRYRLNKLRTENKYNQAELASFIGVNHRTISNWEKGVSEPSNDDIIKLATIFKVTTDYLLGKDKKTRQFIFKKKDEILTNFQENQHKEEFKVIINNTLKIKEIVSKGWITPQEHTQVFCLQDEIHNYMFSFYLNDIIKIEPELEQEN